MTRTLARAVLLALSVPLLAHGAAVLQRSFEEMTSQAHLVVRGTVGTSESRWEDQRISTFTQIQVAEVLKGEAPATITVRQPGGVANGLGQRVAGAATFVAGEEVVLFLERPGDGGSAYVVSGMAAGKVKLRAGPTGQRTASRDLQGISFHTPGERAPAKVQALDQEELGGADAFVQRIRKAARPADPARRQEKTR